MLNMESVLCTSGSLLWDYWLPEPLVVQNVPENYWNGLQMSGIPKELACTIYYPFQRLWQPMLWYTLP